MATRPLSKQEEKELNSQEWFDCHYLDLLVNKKGEFRHVVNGKAGRILKPTYRFSPDGKPYRLQLSVTHYGKGVTFVCDEIIAKTFFPHFTPGVDALMHIDGNLHNCALDNIRVASREEMAVGHYKAQKGLSDVEFRSYGQYGLWSTRNGEIIGVNGDIAERMNPTKTSDKWKEGDTDYYSVINRRQGDDNLYLRCEDIIAKCWLKGYDKDKNALIFIDGNHHNYSANNLKVVNYSELVSFTLHGDTNAKVYRSCKMLDLWCSSDAEFAKVENGRAYPATPVRSNDERGDTRTVYFQVVRNNKRNYVAASKLVANAWIPYYDIENDYITYRDYDKTNIKAENLSITDRRGYDLYTMRNTNGVQCTMERAIEKLVKVQEETNATLTLFRTNKWDDIHRIVNKRLATDLMAYCVDTLHISKNKATMWVSEVICRLYENIDRGMAVFNYERYCKKILLKMSKDKIPIEKVHTAGLQPKDIRNLVPLEDLQRLCDKFNADKSKR